MLNNEAEGPVEWVWEDELNADDCDRKSSPGGVSKYGLVYQSEPGDCLVKRGRSEVGG